MITQQSSVFVLNRFKTIDSLHGLMYLHSQTGFRVSKRVRFHNTYEKAQFLQDLENYSKCDLFSKCVVIFLYQEHSFVICFKFKNGYQVKQKFFSGKLVATVNGF